MISKSERHVTSNRRKSLWGGNRPATIALLLFSFAVFAVGVMGNIHWQVGWVILAIALGFEAVQSLRDLRHRYYLFDAPLFSVGMLLFTVCDPLFAIASNSDFPGVDDSFHPGNLTGNMVGLVVAMFCSSFFIGRLFIRSVRVQTAVVADPHAQLRVTMPQVLLLATGLSILAFLANGGGFSIENLVWTLTARANGYVAFSTSGLGTENPMIALFAQCIPTAIILWVLSIRRGRRVWNGFAILMSIGLFGLFIMLGGRSGVILVVLTISLFYMVQRHMKLRLGRLLFLGGLVMLALSFQTNFRDSGEINQDFFEHSPFRGFALNREIAFIVDTYGEREEFIRGPGFLPRIVLPIPDTIVVFLTNPIPRIIWSGKPVDPSFGPYNEIRTGNTGFGATSNITPTIPGRYYISYGFWGVVQIGFVFGLIWRWFDQSMVNRRRLNSNSVLIGAMLNAIMFISLRDFTFGKFYPLIFLLFFIYISRLLKKQSGRGSANNAKRKEIPSVLV